MIIVFHAFNGWVMDIGGVEKEKTKRKKMEKELF